MNAPLVVVEGTDEAVRDARAQLEADGWRVGDGWRRRGARVVCAGVVATSDDAAAAVLAAVDGAGLVVSARAPRAILDQLLDDLRRLGDVDHRPAVSEPRLQDDERALLELLAKGLSLGDAARRLHISRRTADRRLASARRAFGVSTTAEAVVRARLARF